MRLSSTHLKNEILEWTADTGNREKQRYPGMKGMFKVVFSQIRGDCHSFIRIVYIIPRYSPPSYTGTMKKVPVLPSIRGHSKELSFLPERACSIGFDEGVFKVFTSKLIRLFSSGYP